MNVKYHDFEMQFLARNGDRVKCTIGVTVDFHKIARLLGEKALRSKRGKSQCLYGAVQVLAIKHNITNS